MIPALSKASNFGDMNIADGWFTGLPNITLPDQIRDTSSLFYKPHFKSYDSFIHIFQFILRSVTNRSCALTFNIKNIFLNVNADILFEVRMWEGRTTDSRNFCFSFPFFLNKNTGKLISDCLTAQLIRCVPFFFVQENFKATNLNMQNYLELFIRELKSRATQEN